MTRGKGCNAPTAMKVSRQTGLDGVTVDDGLPPVATDWVKINVSGEPQPSVRDGVSREYVHARPKSMKMGFAHSRPSFLMYLYAGRREIHSSGTKGRIYESTRTRRA